MDALLTDQNRKYRARAREVADQSIRPVAAEYDRKQEYPFSVLEALKEAELTGVWIPKEYGGEGAGVLNLCIVVEELSRACGGVGVAYAVNSLGSFPIILGGTPEQKEEWLPYIARGERLISFALSEKMAGSDAGALSCSIAKDGGEYVINGNKKWNTNGGIAHYYTVYGSTRPDRAARGISAVMVEKGAEGFSIGKIEDKMGIRCVPVVELDFNDCRVPEKNLVGGKENVGFGNAMSTLDRARPCVAAQALGLAQGAFELAVEWTRKRSQFGQSIASNQAVQFMLADMATQIEAARQLVYRAATMVDAEAAGFSKYAAMSKVFATDTAMKVTTDAVQLFGGYGFMKDYPIEKYMRDAKITQIYEGTNQVQRIVISRALIREAANWGWDHVTTPNCEAAAAAAAAASEE
jgi:alkylation response protein AidB-like acyl-CoA dehydrogenase